MTIALCVLAMLGAFALIWRGFDVRVVLFTTALAIGALAGAPSAVLRKTLETLAEAKFLLPICGAMGFAYVVRETGCVAALVRLLVGRVLRVPRLVLPGCAAVALIVNAAVPSQTSTLAAVGGLLLALLASLQTRAAVAGTVLIFGSSICGAVLNPGVAEVVAVARLTGLHGAEVVVALAPGVLASFAVGLTALLAARRLGVGRDDRLLGSPGASDPDAQPAWKAIFPPLPILWLLLAHPSLPWHAWLAPALVPGLEVVTAMLAGAGLTILFASRDRKKSLGALFDGMGYAFAHVITLIAVSTGVAKALEVAGVLGAFVEVSAGSPALALAFAFGLAFVLGVVSGSGTAPSVALIGALGGHAAELGVSPLALGGVILFGAEAGRTTSPVAAVVLFGSALVDVPPRALVARLFLPCLLAAAAGALVVALRLQ